MFSYFQKNAVFGFDLEWRVINRWILIRHLKQILEYLTSSCGSTIIIHLLMGGF
jgi:hypothetical protein